MSVNSSTHISGNQLPPVDTTGRAAPPPSPSGTNAAPTLQTREQAALTGWRDLPDDVLALLFASLITEAISVSTTPAARFEALQTLVQLWSVANQEKKLLQTFLENNRLDLEGIRKEILKARSDEWKSRARGLADRRDTLLKDFSVTREALLASIKSSGLPPALPDSCEGVHLCFREISLTPAMGELISGLKEKTVKIDAKAIGRERFLSEVLPALEKLPASCKVVLDAGSNGLTAQDLDKLVDVMSRKPFIYRLDLTGNPLSAGGNHQRGFTQLFRQAGPLTHLYLAETGFDYQAAVTLGNALTKARHLEHLDLRNNLLKDDGGAAALINATLPDATDVSELERLHALRVIRLGGNLYQDNYDLWEADLTVQGRWIALIQKASNEMPDDSSRVFDSAPRTVFDIPPPPESSSGDTRIRLDDDRAAADRL